MRKLVPISQVQANPQNPRVKHDEKFAKLVQSIKDFPEMMEKRPTVVETIGKDKYQSLGGNMRYEAHVELGMKEIWIDTADSWTPEQKEEFVIKDNLSYGEWDFEMLDQNFDTDTLIDWGLTILFFEDTSETDADKHKRLVEEKMKLQFHEHHDYLVFLFDNEDDWVHAISVLKVGKARVSLSPKRKKIGIGRVLPASQLIKLFPK